MAGATLSVIAALDRLSVMDLSGWYRYNCLFKRAKSYVAIRRHIYRWIYLPDMTEFNPCYYTDLYKGVSILRHAVPADSHLYALL